MALPDGLEPAGGAHKRRPRRLHPAITQREAANAQAAWSFAIDLGYAPNRFVSINWATACIPQHPMDRLSRLRDQIKSWLRRWAPGVPPIWIEVREKTRMEGEHVHLVLHVPAPLEERFSEALRGWVARDMGHVDENTLCEKAITNWRGLLRYLMKGGDAEVRQVFPSRHSQAQGVIEGPRVRVAHAIGYSARRDRARAKV